ncbi:transposase, partial [Thiolapillus sp.]|uniref:transposase n=1 Tax=Thiolapillus sp. TaxID=2017437 RepID=UPI003AF6AD53
MSKEKPKIYPPEFRESSVKLAIESDQSIAQTAKELGINPNTLHTWISKYSKPSQSRPVVKRTDEHLYDLSGLDTPDVWHHCIDYRSTDEICRMRQCNPIKIYANHGKSSLAGNL